LEKKVERRKEEEDEKKGGRGLVLGRKG